jgi:hypothetical protein
MVFFFKGPSNIIVVAFFNECNKFLRDSRGRGKLSSSFI